MILSEMIKMLEDNVDDAVTPATAVRWLNAGQNEMAAEAKAMFPQLTITPTLDATFVFPEKYHEIPVLYASAMMKAQDSSIGEKESFLRQYAAKLNTFLENYTPPMHLRDDEQTQQFVATEGQTEFMITKTSYHKTGNLQVYVNDLSTILFSTNGRSILLGLPCTAGDYVTATWEIRPDLQSPPYAWWGGW